MHLPTAVVAATFPDIPAPASTSWGPGSACRWSGAPPPAPRPPSLNWEQTLPSLTLQEACPPQFSAKPCRAQLS